MKLPLPIDPFLPALAASLEASPCAVLVAEPGAGKTTRVPPALANTAFASGKQIWVLQPRRLAALVAAWRVAEENGGKPGGFVGYHFRFERAEAKDTRVLFLTEGMFLRRLQGNPTLEGVACVVLDEFHERSLDADLGLALLRRLRRDKRPDLRLLVMSATLDAKAVATALDGAPVIDCPGRTFPVDVKYAERDRSDPSEPIEKRAVRGLKDLAGVEGDILVFLPGSGEIRRSASRLAGDPYFERFSVLSLYGSLSPAEQRRVLGPAEKQKIILSTNVAETSLTVPGVRAVVDSTFTRKDAFNPWTGLSALVTQPASQASLTQRAGRAGREAPGLCLRLCSPAEAAARPKFDPPEILRADLADAMLESLAAGFPDLGELDWLEAPEPSHLESARRVLAELGAVDAQGSLTPKGRALAKAPLHPRLASVAWESRYGNDEELDSLLRALILLSEERLRDLEFFTALKRFQPEGATQRLYDQLKDWIEGEKGRPGATLGPWPLRLSQALLTAFPDQVAFTRLGTDKRGETRFALCGGGEAVARDESLHLREGLYLLLDVLEQRSVAGTGWAPKVLSLLPLEAEWLLERLPHRLRDEAKVVWDAAAKRVKAEGRLMYGELVLSQGSAEDPAAKAKAKEVLLAEARKAGLGAFCGEHQPGRYLARREFALRGAGEDAPRLPDEGALWKVLEDLAEGARGFDDLSKADPLRAALSLAGEDARKFLESRAPRSLRLASGRECSIHYEEGKPPWVESRIQDFFGMRSTPSVAGQPATVHLLAPNGRAQQVTQDLKGFWEREYPRVRKELMRKYPRHKWPEEPV